MAEDDRDGELLQPREVGLEQVVRRGDDVVVTVQRDDGEGGGLRVGGVRAVLGAQAVG